MLHQNGFKSVLNERIHALHMIYVEKKTVSNTKGREIGASSRGPKAGPQRHHGYFGGKCRRERRKFGTYYFTNKYLREVDFFHVFLIFLDYL